MAKNRVFIYDTTLRDGSQGEGVSFNLDDKIKVAKRLDAFGIDYIEGGWPGSNPKDARFFEHMRKQKLKHAKLVAFGSTRRKNCAAKDDPNLQGLLEAGTFVITIFGKSWDFHVKEVLKTSLKDNLEIIASSVAFLKKNKKEVIYDAEHFFDGYQANPDYAIETLLAAQNAGADALVLCDTNGGMLPAEIREAVQKVKASCDLPIGIHCHNDSGLAVANSLEAVTAGATQVQGTINGYGERTGNANLCTIIPNLVLKTHHTCIDKRKLKQLMDVSYYVSELANMVPDDRQAYVGFSAFAHKGGMHVNAVQKNPKSFEHIVPDVVGNQRRVLISDLSGKSNIMLKARELKLDLDDDSPQVKEILAKVKELEHQGYSFEAADASLKLLIQRTMGKQKDYFKPLKYRVIVEESGEDGLVAEATVKIDVKGQAEYTVAEGDGPVNALDKALREALCPYYPELKTTHLTDFKVRVLNATEATAAKVRVLIQSRDKQESWETVGVSENIIEACWFALLDSVEYKLAK